MEYFVVIDQIDKSMLGMAQTLEECADLFLKEFPRVADYIGKLGKKHGVDSANSYLVQHFQDDLNHMGLALSASRAIPVTVWRCIIND